MSDNFNDLFNLKADDFIEKPKESEFYRISPEKGRGGVYKSLVRFIPWWKDPKNSYVEKWVSWMTDPVSEKSMSIDCPSSIGQKSVLSDWFWKLKKSESAAEQQLATHFSRRQTFFAIIQVLEDENNTDAVGKFKIFKFGIKIFEKIQAELKPEYGKPHIPFDLFTGKPFLIKLKKVGGYNNYDDCKFIDEPSPLSIGGQPVERTQEGVQTALEFLKKNSPDLDKYKFREWNEETRNFVNTVIKNVVPASLLSSGALATANNNQSSTPAAPTAPAVEAAPAAPAAPATEAPTAQPETTSVSELASETTSDLGADTGLESDASLDDGLDIDDDLYNFDED